MGLISPLTAIGILVASTMPVTYALEPRGSRWVLAFALACFLSGVYGVAAGAWPLGVVEMVWSVIAVLRWHRVVQTPRAP